MINKPSSFELNTIPLLRDYAYSINGINKIFCPNCFILLNEKKADKHFTSCSFLVKGREILKYSDLSISMIYDDSIFLNFLRRFNKFLILESDQFKGIPLGKNYEYWILQKTTREFGKLLIGLAFVRHSNDFDRFILPAMILFPEYNQGQHYGTLMMKTINEYYKKLGGIVVESPNKRSFGIVKRLNLNYYFHL